MNTELRARMWPLMWPIICLFLGLAVLPTPSFADLKIVTTTTTLAQIAQEVGGSHVTVSSITRGAQDPHYVEAKPSYALKLREANLLISVGLELEVGWLPILLRKARKPSLMDPKRGHLVAGDLIQPIGVVEGRIDRAQGDIHGAGNPHFHWDPVRVVEVAQGMAKRFADLDPENQAFYRSSVESFAKRVKDLTEKWQTRLASERLKLKGVITHHHSFDYFFERFGVPHVGTIESKPGIPPSTQHILGLVSLIKSGQANCVVLESYFETGPADRLKKETAVQVHRVAVEVQGLPRTGTYSELVESMVAALEKCASTHGEHTK